MSKKNRIEVPVAPNEALVTVPCKMCQRPVNICIPDGGGEFKAEIEKLLPMAVHDSCYDDHRRRQRAAARVADEAARAEDWKKICPLEYRKPLDWSKRNCKRPIYQAVMNWPFGAKGLLILGRTGLCKTRFAYKLLEREFLVGRKIMAYHHSDLRLKSSMLAKEDMKQLERFMDLLIKAEILLVDDLGKGNLTPASEEAFAYMIDGRYRANRPCVFTTNDVMDQLAQRFSDEYRDAVMRRIVESVSVVDCDALSKPKVTVTKTN